MAGFTTGQLLAETTPFVQGFLIEEQKNSRRVGALKIGQKVFRSAITATLEEFTEIPHNDHPERGHHGEAPGDVQYTLGARLTAVEQIQVEILQFGRHQPGKDLLQKVEVEALFTIQIVDRLALPIVLNTVQYLLVVICTGLSRQFTTRYRELRYRRIRRR